MQFAERLREMREKRGMTQRQLAKVIGVSRQAIGLYEKGVREPDLSTIQKLAQVLGTSMSYLVGETDDPSPPPQVGVAAHRQGGSPGDPLEAEVQLIIERAVREVMKKRDEWLRRRQQEDKRDGGTTEDRRT